MRVSGLNLVLDVYIVSGAFPFKPGVQNFGTCDLHSLSEPEDEENFDEEDNSSRPTDPQGPETVELSLAAVQHHVDVLLEEWNKSADVLFSIHPMDGSLLVWHVDWLDEYQPGMFRQAQVGLLLIFIVLM